MRTMVEEIKKRTGLETQGQILAYRLFCNAADFNSGLISEDYLASCWLKSKRRCFYWVGKFLNCGLVKHCLVGIRKIPMLKLVGYNYMNDPQFYVKYKNKGEKEWSGRMSKEYRKTLEEEKGWYMKKLIFKEEK